MAHTYYQNLYHLVWSTKEREPHIQDSHKDRVFNFLGGTFRTAGCVPLQIGGMPDHIHALVGIPPKFAISEVIRDVKVASSKWMCSSFPECRSFSWQEGYGSFTVSVSQKDAVYRYVVNQEAHHKKRDFKGEFIELLNSHGIEFDEKYLWR